jgi:D-alanine-D-alanine ligase
MTPPNRPGRSQVKHDPEYQESCGIVAGPAKKLASEQRARILQLAKRICRTLELDGDARIDFRVSADDTSYFLEANPTPEMAAARRRCRILLDRIWLGNV